MNKDKFEQVCSKVAFDCGSYIKKMRESMQIETKADLSLVTNIDLALEIKIKQEFSKYFPNLNFLGEEYGFESNNGDYTLIIDPIDGTEAFIKTGKNYSIAIALEDLVNSQILFGCVYDVADEVLYLNEKRISKNPIKLREDMIVHGNPIIHLQAQDKFGKVGIYLKGSSTALNMTRCLWGEYGIYLSDSKNIKIWDVAPAVGIEAHLKTDKLLGLNDNFDYKNPHKSGLLIINN